MFDTSRLSTKLSLVALLCVCAILLAWAAPLIISSGAAPEALLCGQSRQTAEPVEAPTEIEDASDDPIAFVANDRPGILPVVHILQTAVLVGQTWSPTALVPPPNHLNSI